MTDFAIFILTHGRPENVVTLKTLKRCNYTGKYYIIIDNEDTAKDDYLKKFGDKVIVFDKINISKKFDEADNFNDRRSIVYARNASFEIAKKLNIKYFMQLDDDYTEFCFRFDNDFNYKYKTIKKLDNILNSILKFYKKTNILSIALAQGGDFIGGSNSGFAKKIQFKRKCMNTFICSTDREFKFVGRINEDVNTYTSLASRGGVFFTTNLVSINQLQTQSNNGGMTDIYLDNGTYIKSFYTIIFSPSSVKINLMGNKNKRLHHKVKWNNTVPKILSEIHKKN